MSYSNGIGSFQQPLKDIGQTVVKGPEVKGAQALGQKGDTGLQGSAAAVKADQTSLSVTGGAIAEALRGSDTRMEKVASLQAAIAAGTYKVASGDVADKMIASLLG